MANTPDDILFQLHADIYGWIDHEIQDNLIRLCQPKYLDEVATHAVELFTQLMGFSDMFSDTYPIRFVDICKKQFPKHNVSDSTIPEYDWSNDSDKDDDNANDDNANDSDVDGNNGEIVVSLSEMVQEIIQEVLLANGIPEYSTRQEDDDSPNQPEEQISEILNRLSSIRYPAQRSPEWYISRFNLFSASAIHKLFSTPAQYNSLVYEKCNVNNNVYATATTTKSDAGPNEATDARTWGVKYEPLSAALYEHLNPGTAVRTDYGCIPHQKYSCIGASPDGINISTDRLDKYGRMVEIKNIVNREITGIPKQEYWIQMQFQMEVCNLTKCDFVETRFVEYHSETDFYEDDEEKEKGVILRFMPLNETNIKAYDETNNKANNKANANNNIVNYIDFDPEEPELLVVTLPDGCGQPKSSVHSEYVYMPFYVRHKRWAIRAYIAEQCKLRESTHMLASTTYWCLDEYSCVVVKHNPVWIQAAIPIIEQAWETVLRERATGAEHRAPKKRAPVGPKCLL